MAATLQIYMQGLKDNKNFVWMDNGEWPHNTLCAFELMDRYADPTI